MACKHTHKDAPENSVCEDCKLSSKRKENELWKPSKDFGFYWEEDVKQALKRLQKKALIDLQTGFLTIRWSDVKEIFGEELING